MNLLTVEQVTKSYGEKVLFNGVSMGINQGEKIGLIGVNGTGKSTLLKIIAGMEAADDGQVVKGNTVRIAYLPQTPEFDPDRTVLENVISGKESEKSYWNLEGQARAMLLKLGIDHPEQITSELSGGQRKRAALVRTLLSPADILILDEPTNHLDNEMAAWLENYLNQFEGAILMITHDRYFLDKVTNRIVELDQGKLYSYHTNYSGFLELKAQREEMELATERKKESLYRIDLEWIRRGARARSTKQKAHIQRFEELKNREKPKEEQKIAIRSVSSRLGKQIIELKGVSKRYAEHVLFEDFTYIFLKNDRIGIIGNNGCGKSTLLKIIQGIEKADQGEIVTGQTVRIGYFSQENEWMPKNQRVIDYIRDTAEYIETEDGKISASKMLERFLFDGAMQYSMIEKLSGGEKRRLYLLKVLMEAPNVLILDEPTNDLDIQTLRILEDYLDHFEGVVITVSHDRYFLDRVVDRIFSFEDRKVVLYEGNYSDYREKSKNARKAGQEGQIKEETEKKKKTAASQKPKTKKLRFTYNEQREYETIDEEIEKIEQMLSELEVQIEKDSGSYSKLQELYETKEKLETQLEEKMERWVYLNDIAEKMKTDLQGGSHGADKTNN